ncbi:MAG: VWA domain-containing protein [bacterium]
MSRLLPLLPVALCACTAATDAPAAPTPAPDQPAAAAAENPAAAAAAADNPAAAAAAEQPAAAPKPLQIAAPEPAPGSVSVRVIPQFDRLGPDGARELNLLVRLEGIGEVTGPRPPLDLALVIDRSGSMAGDKLRDVKAAALKLLDDLRPEDTVTLISYSDDVKRHTTGLPVDAKGREVLRNALLGLESEGSTALGPAMMQALDDLEAGRRDDRRLTHAMLLSDGLANVGEQRPEILGARAAAAFTRGVSVTTLGVGLDYNEDLMTRLADQGGGRYHFIKDGDAVAGILADEMKGLVATVARGIVLELAPAPGAGVAKVFGYATDRQDTRASARIGSLGAGQTREVVVRLALPALTPPRAALGALTVRFVDISADGAAREVTVPIAVEVTPDAAAVAASEHHDVTVRVAEVEAAEKLEIAARAADSGDFAGARGSLQVAIDDLKQKRSRKPSPKLDKQIMELEEARDEVQQAQGSAEGRKAYTKKFKAKAYDNRKK